MGRWSVPWFKSPSPVPPPLVQAVCVEPTGENTGWSDDNTYGNRLFVPGGPVLGGLVANEITNVVTAERLPGPPQPTTVHLYRSDFVQSTPPRNYAIYANVRYGAGLASNVLRIDWTMGVQFSIVCDRVAVDILPYVPLGGAFTSDLNLTFGATVGRGRGQPGTSSPTFTSSRVTVANAASTAFVVPDLARRFRILGIDRGASNVYAVGNFVGVFPTDLSLTADRFATADWWPLPGGAQTIVYANNGAAPVTLQFQFEIGL